MGGRGLELHLSLKFETLSELGFFIEHTAKEESKRN